MDPLGSVSPIIEVLRRQMSENLEKLRRDGTLRPGSNAARGIAGKQVAPNLRQTLSRRIATVDAKDPQYQERATAIFVESVLVSEFGEELINDPEFRLMIRSVSSRMSAEPTIAQDLARLFAELGDARQ